VTSIGAITPLGATFADSWSRLIDASLPAPISVVPSLASLPCAYAATASLPSSSPKDVTSQRSRFLQLAMQAALDADVGRTSKLYPYEACGVSVGSGIGSIESITSAHDALVNKSHRKISPHFVPSILANSAAGVISQRFALKGPNTSYSTACATGAHSIIDAYRFVRDGEAELMVAGGAEASVDPLSMAGFSRLRALSTRFEEEPEKSSRPFDSKRDGFVMGEGACVLVLESLEAVLERGDGATILAEVLGYGCNGDAYHPTAPDPEGRGAERAMAQALKSAGRTVDEVDYVNCHATSTPMGDEIEVKAIEKLVSRDTRKTSDPLLISSTKGATGHLLGAAGALEAAFTVQAIVSGTVPDTKNLEAIDVGEYSEEKIRILKNGEVKERNIRLAISNSFGFGGVNSSILFGAFSK